MSRNRHSPTHWTYQDYLELPDDGNRYEIIEGERFVAPAPTPRHQAVVAQLVESLYRFLQGRGLGRCLPSPIDVLLTEDTFVQPDVVYVAAENLARIQADGIRGAPDLIFEVLSPSTRRVDHTSKRNLYGRTGVLEYWILDPEIRRIEVFVLENDRLIVHGDAREGGIASPRVLPGFEVTGAHLFQDPTTPL